MPNHSDRQDRNAFTLLVKHFPTSGLEHVLDRRKVLDGETLLVEMLDDFGRAVWVAGRYLWRHFDREEPARLAMNSGELVLAHHARVRRLR